MRRHKGRCKAISDAKAALDQADVALERAKQDYVVANAALSRAYALGREEVAAIEMAIVERDLDQFETNAQYEMYFEEGMPYALDDDYSDDATAAQVVDVDMERYEEANEIANQIAERDLAEYQLAQDLGVA
ncbi:MAG: hypothetical protein NT062_25155 [Proteobacteria bacterium]|nr:hypothetical protein [Pseudomonadota bacterium]